MRARLACSHPRWQGCLNVESGARRCTLLGLCRWRACLLRASGCANLLSLAAHEHQRPLPASNRAQAWAHARVTL